MAEGDLRNWMREDEAMADDDIAQQVSAALRRVQAPEGFTERLLARVETAEESAPLAHPAEPEGHGVLLQFTRPAWRAAYAAAALLALTAGAIRVEHVRGEQRRADQASAQFDTALQVTDHALDHVTAKLETTEFGQVQRALETNAGGK